MWNYKPHTTFSNNERPRSTPLTARIVFPPCGHYITTTRSTIPSTIPCYRSRHRFPHPRERRSNIMYAPAFPTFAPMQLPAFCSNGVPTESDAFASPSTRHDTGKGVLFRTRPASSHKFLKLKTQYREIQEYSIKPFKSIRLCVCCENDFECRHLIFLSSFVRV